MKVMRLIGCSLMLLSCSADVEEVSSQKQEIKVEYSQQLLQESWPVRMAKLENRASFEGVDGWVSYYNKDYAGGIRGLSGAGQARAHLELSALYRQAALMHSYATEHIYGPPKNDTPLLETLYLRGVARAVLGRKEEAGSDLEKFIATLSAEPSAKQLEIKGRAEQWLAWSKTASEAPKLSGFFFTDAPPVAGQIPKTDGPSHYYFMEDVTQRKEKEEDPLPPIEIEASEGTSLYLRARWHEEAARGLLSAEEQKLVDAWLLPWALPIDSFTNGYGEEELKLSDDWLFLGYYLVAEDLLFLSELATWRTWKKPDTWTDEDRGKKAAELKAYVDKWSGSSLLAAALAPALEVRNIKTEQSNQALAGKESSDEQRLLLVPDILLELASKLKKDSFNEMKSQNGEAEPLFETFSSFAELALLRAGVLVAEANGQYRDAGILRLNINDIATGPNRDPLFHIGMGAWDVGNKYTMRAQDFIHTFSAVAPGLESARVPLDQLHIRLGRETTTGGPAH